MKIVFAGTPPVAVPTLDALISAGHSVVGVITREDALVGRKRVLTPSPVAARSAELQIPTLKTNRLNHDAVAWAERLQPEVGVVVAYGGLLKPDMLEVPSLGWINLHFSHLPHWRGAAPVQRALMAGEQDLGMSVFRLVTELDAGDLLTTGTEHVSLGTTAGEALDALAQSGTSLVLEALTMLRENPQSGSPQTGQANYAHKLLREDGKLDPTQDRDRFVAHWAGVTPAPGAFVYEGGNPIKIHALTLTDTLPNREPGTVTLESNGAVLHLADGTVLLDRVQPAGKAAMDAKSWLRGRGGEVRVS